MKNSIKEKYIEAFSISDKDYADIAESNRLNILVISTLLILSDIIDWITTIAVYHDSLGEHIHYFIYLTIYTPLNLYIFFHARHTKQGSNLAKTIPAYLIFFVGLSAAVFNFYYMNSPHNGFVTYYLSGFLFLIFVSVSPIGFAVELFAALAFLLPGIYKTYGLLSMIDSIVVSIIMFSVSLYKRHFEKKLIALLKKQKKVLEAKTFGNFTIFFKGKAVAFSRSKSEELMAYLIYKNGTSVKTKELISILWGDKADSTRYGGNFRNLIVDIKHTFKELGIQDFFISEYNNFRINPEIIKCDYYDFLNGDQAAIKSFMGEFLSQYSWAEDVAGLLEQKAFGQK